MNLKMGILALAMIASLEIEAKESLKSVVASVLDSSPIVFERLKNYRNTRANIDLAEAGYLPTLDLKLSKGHKRVGDFNGDILKNNYSVFQNSLILRQNIFDGFSTHERVNYQKMRTLAAGYSYLEKANDVVLQTIIIYLEVQKNYELVNNAKINVNHNTKIYKNILKAYKGGISTMSEVSKIHASLSLAQSNLRVQESRFRNAKYNYRKLVGRSVQAKELIKVKFTSKIPSSLRNAEMYALEYNPSLIVGKYNIKGEEALYRESKSAFFPKLSLEISQNYNKNYDDFTRDDDRFQAMLILSYNLYNGGADEAKRVMQLSRLAQEIEVSNELKRKVIENIDLSWSTYQLAKEEIPFLKEYRKHSVATLKFYTKEYKLGQRSMLDLISAENDLKRSNDELIGANYNLLIGKYRIMDSIGLSIVSILGEEAEYYNRVGMGKTNKHRRDRLPILRDRDRDNIIDTLDSSPQSRKRRNVSHIGRGI